MCCTEEHNTYTMVESRTHPGQTLGKQLPCQLCGEMTILPTGGVEALSLHQKSALGGVASLQLGPTLIYDSRDSTRSLAGQQQSHAKLLWHYTGHKTIRDLAFISDGSVVFITQGRKYTELCLVDRDGQPGTLPFPAAFTRPLKLASSIDGKTLAVTDWRGDAHSVVILRHDADLWTSWDITTSKQVHSIAVMSTSECVCSVGYDTVVRYRGGKSKWTKSLPGSGMMFLPYLAMYVTGDVIISNPNNNEVSVLNSKGKLEARFPSRFIKWPTGICVNSHGNVLVADQASDVISMFTVGGVFVREVVQLDTQPLDIDLYEDRYLAVSTGDNGILMYDLKV
jgi:DNA-binding beta-propeller fold protein YncE